MGEGKPDETILGSVTLWKETVSGSGAILSGESRVPYPSLSEGWNRAIAQRATHPVPPTSGCLRLRAPGFPNAFWRMRLHKKSVIIRSRFFDFKDPLAVSYPFGGSAHYLVAGATGAGTGAAAAGATAGFGAEGAGVVAGAAGAGVAAGFGAAVGGVVAAGASTFTAGVVAGAVPLAAGAGAAPFAAAAGAGVAAAGAAGTAGAGTGASAAGAAAGAGPASNFFAVFEL